MGGAVDKPVGILGLGTEGTVGACVTEGAGAADDAGVGAEGAEGFDGCDAMLGLASSMGFLQTLDPKAGTAAGGDDARGA